jgi:hypothetical protein
MKKLMFFLIAIMLLPFVEMNAQSINNTCNLPKPQKLKVSSITHNQAKATWNSVSNAFGYSIKLYDLKDSLLLETNSNVPTFTFSNLEAGKDYKLKVAARCKNGNVISVSQNFTMRCFKTDIVIITDVVMRNIPNPNNIIGQSYFGWSGGLTKYILHIKDDNSISHYLGLEFKPTQGAVFASINVDNLQPFNLPMELDGNSLSIVQNQIPNTFTLDFDANGFRIGMQNTSWDVELYLAN